MTSFAIRQYRKLKNALFGSAVVLMYHRVADVLPNEDPQNLCIGTELFEQHLMMLKKQYVVEALPKICHQLHAKQRIRPNTICITFDDGYADNFEIAADLLARHNLPATFFVATGPLNNQERFYWDELSTLTNTEDEYWSWCNTLQTNTPARRRELLEQARRPSLPSNDERRFDLYATTEHLRNASANPLFTIGGHTVNHPWLSALNDAEQLAEITDNKTSLETIIGMPVELFAYPYGTPDSIGQSTPRLVGSAGYSTAFTTSWAQLDCTKNLLLAPRVSAYNETAGDLAERIERYFGRKPSSSIETLLD